MHVGLNWRNLSFSFRTNWQIETDCGFPWSRRKKGNPLHPPPHPHLSSPLPSDRVRDAVRETAIKLQPRPHGSVFFGKFKWNRLCFKWQSSDLIATLFQIFLADYKISPKIQRRPGTTSTVFVLYFPKIITLRPKHPEARPLSVLCKWESFNSPLDSGLWQQASKIPFGGLVYSKMSSALPTIGMLW